MSATRQTSGSIGRNHDFEHALVVAASAETRHARSPFRFFAKHLESRFRMLFSKNTWNEYDER